MTEKIQRNQCNPFIRGNAYVASSVMAKRTLTQRLPLTVPLLLRWDRSVRCASKRFDCQSKKQII